MVYTKTIWKNRSVERPRTYTVQNNPDGSITLIPAPGDVYEAGTSVTAAAMNNMENQIEALDDTRIYISATEPTGVKGGQVWWRII